MTCTANECHAKEGACATCKHNVERLEADNERLQTENTRLRQEWDNALTLLEHCDEWRMAYQRGVYQLFAMSAEIRDAAVKVFPCSEGPLNRAIMNTWIALVKRVKAENAILAKAVQLTRKADDAAALCEACQSEIRLGRLCCDAHRQLREDAEAAESEALVLIKKGGVNNGSDSPCSPHM